MPRPSGRVVPVGLSSSRIRNEAVGHSVRPWPDVPDHVGRVTSTARSRRTRVIAVARRKERLKELADRLERVTAEPCDVTDEDATQEVLRRAQAAFGDIDILLNNVGINEPGSAETETTESFRRVLETNVVAAFTIRRHVGQGMLARGSGSIINLGSVFGLKGVADAPTGYAISKAATRPHLATGGTVVRLRRPCQRHRPRAVPQRDERLLQ